MPQVGKKYRVGTTACHRGKPDFRCGQSWINFKPPEKNFYSDAAGWYAARFECPTCLHVCGYVFPGDVDWLECPKCGDESHIDECITEWWTGQDTDDDEN